MFCGNPFNHLLKNVKGSILNRELFSTIKPTIMQLPDRRLSMHSSPFTEILKTLINLQIVIEVYGGKFKRVALPCQGSILKGKLILTSF